MEKKYYAHSLEGKPPEEWQPLEEHLRNVAKLAKSFASQFGVGDCTSRSQWHSVTTWEAQTIDTRGHGVKTDG
jgi:hypothetical protein